MNLFLIGDSTMQFNDITTYPQTGWGQVLNMFFNKDVNIINLAKNGRSTKSFKEEQRFEPVMQNIKPGDYVICQFGHNDPKDDPLRYSSIENYIKNLDYYAKSVISKGGNIVFCTSICRCEFENSKIKNTHLGYPEAMMKYALDNNILCIDLHTSTRNLFNNLGDKESRKLFMDIPSNTYKNYPEGKKDLTHLVYKGAIEVAILFANELKNSNNDLKKYLI